MINHFFVELLNLNAYFSCYTSIFSQTHPPICGLQLQNLEACTLLVELHLSRPYPYRGSDMSTWEVKINNLLLNAFSCHIVVKMNALNTGHWSIALPRQGALTAPVPLIFHPIPLAAQEYFRNVQAA